VKGPLESTKYHILLALASGPQHGAAIRDQIIGDTLGTYLRDSTLYDALPSLLRAKLIEELPSHEPRRRQYQLTDRGKQALEWAARTHKRAAELAYQRLGLR